MFKANNKNVNSPTPFCLRSISDKFFDANSGEVSLEENVNDVSHD